MTRQRGGRRWLPSEISHLRVLRAEGLTVTEIATRLGRTCQAVSNKSKQLEIPNLKPGHVPWSEQELNALRHMAAASCNNHHIAARLGRTKTAVARKKTEICLHPAAATGKARVLRKCLNCTRRFMSQGPHNRLCNCCRRLSLDPFDAPAVVMRP